MVEAGYSVNTGGTISVNWTEINTTHGYQATPKFFIGAGVGFHFIPDMKEGVIDGKPHWKRDSSLVFQESYMYNKGKYDYDWSYKDIEESQSAVSLKVGFEF
ncbi:MAG: hypothetical protein IJ693_09060 [Bacteroidaceae bacterium]|nr:hypothetical protein [Bacteroidaceae bacterium]